MPTLIRDRGCRSDRDFRDEMVKPIALGRHDRLRGGDGLRVGDAASGEQYYRDRETHMTAKGA